MIGEWDVRFDKTGFRTSCPQQEFMEEQEVPNPKPVASNARAEPMSRRQFEARKLIEALRFGVAPVQFVRELTIGLEEERASLITGLHQAHQEGGAVRVVIGDYGFGKSHLVGWTAQEALAQNFLVATTSLDLMERPPNRPFEIYRALICNLRYPDHQARGVTHLLEKATELPHMVKKYGNLSSVKWDSLTLALDAFQNSASVRQRQTAAEWLEGGAKVDWMHFAVPDGMKFPMIYKTGHNARQIGYLLGGISALARLANYSGLCILIDEAESYSLLPRKQRPKAQLFFKSMIYATLREQQTDIQPNTLPQHRYRNYPAAFDKHQSLFFLFTVTRNQHHLPLDQWLHDSQMLNLEPQYNPRQIGIFLKQVLHYHTQAYNYQPDTRHGQVRRAAAENLALGMRYNRLNVRALVRLTVELFDLLYLHQEFPVVKLLSQLRAQMRGE